MWYQRTVRLSPRTRGFHLVTSELENQLPELALIEVGLAHFFILHTSASLTINENADPSVRGDMERHFNHQVPEGAPYYEHTCEGPDDMPAHIKSSLMGSGITLPIRDGELLLGTWQGIYLGEHRDRGGPRSVVVTMQGQSADE